jgi:hypothetical protein
LEELGNGKGKLAKASEEGQGPRRAVEPMMMMMSVGPTLGRHVGIELNILRWSGFHRQVSRTKILYQRVDWLESFNERTHIGPLLPLSFNISIREG